MWRHLFWPFWKQPKMVSKLALCFQMMATLNNGWGNVLAYQMQLCLQWKISRSMISYKCVPVYRRQNCDTGKANKSGHLCKIILFF